MASDFHYKVPNRYVEQHKDLNISLLAGETTDPVFLVKLADRRNGYRSFEAVVEKEALQRLYLALDDLFKEGIL